MLLRVGLLVIFLISLTIIFYNVLKQFSSLNKIQIQEKIFDIDQKMVTSLDSIFLGKNKSRRKVDFFSKYNKMLKESHFRWIGIRNIYTLTILSAAFSYFVFTATATFLNQELAAVLCAVWAFTIPYELVKIDISNERKKIRKHLPHFFLNILQVDLLTSDIQETFKHLVGNIKRPLNGHIAALVRDIEFGVEPKEAFRRVKEKTSIEILLRFYESAERSMKEGTKMKDKLQELAEDAYDEEYFYQSRITENVGGFTSIIIIIIFGVLLISGVNSLMPDSFYILRTNPIGQIAVSAFIGCSFISVKMIRAAIAYKD